MPNRPMKTAKTALGLLLAATIVLISEAISAGSTGDMSSHLNCAPFTKAALPAPAPRTDPHAIERFHLLNSAIKSGPDVVLFLGDSLTEDWDAAVWQQHFG